METVTQLLLVSQSSGSSLDSVAELFSQQEGSIEKTAAELGVPADAYSSEKVQASLADAQAAAAESAKKEATDQVEDAAGKALDSLGGLMKD